MCFILIEVKDLKDMVSRIHIYKVGVMMEPTGKAYHEG